MKIQLFLVNVNIVSLEELLRNVLDRGEGHLLALCQVFIFLLSYNMYNLFQYFRM
jgi:hypothetical protein